MFSCCFLSTRGRMTTSLRLPMPATRTLWLSWARWVKRPSLALCTLRALLDIGPDLWNTCQCCSCFSVCGCTYYAKPVVYILWELKTSSRTAGEQGIAWIESKINKVNDLDFLFPRHSKSVIFRKRASLFPSDVLRRQRVSPSEQRDSPAVL